MVTLTRILLLVVVSFATEIAPVDNVQFWEVDGASVVYGVVLDVKLPTANTEGALQVQPLVTLSGALDAAFAGDILARVSMSGSYGDVILTPPAKGSKVIMLLRRAKQRVGNLESEYIR